MSNRRKPGDIVWKPAGYGFTGQSGLGLIPEGSNPSECMEDCGDPDCQEWPDMWPLDASGKPTGGNWCHVSECQMQDAPANALSLGDTDIGHGTSNVANVGQVKIITASFKIPHVGANPIPGVGILAVAGMHPDFPPLVLMVDMQELNQGASLTNSAEAAITHFSRTHLLPASADPASAYWIEMDSMGMFDEMLVRMDGDSCIAVSWAPLKSMLHFRTLEAFTCEFGSRGEDVWRRALAEIRRGNYVR